MVLGLVTPSDDDDDQVENESSQPCNDLEVQIISKSDGSILYSNILPMLRDIPTSVPAKKKKGEAHAVVSESAAAYTLLSSFALPRMEDTYEAEVENLPDEEFEIQVSLFSPTSASAKRFVDPHLKWNLAATLDDDENETIISFGETLDAGGGAKRPESSGCHDNKDEGDGDSGSVDSDDYGFIFQPLSTHDGKTSQVMKGSVPPLMIITSNSDAVLTRMRDLDDAVAHALAAGKSALALKRALRQRRRLRRFELSDLVNDYFSALLRTTTNQPKTETAELSGARSSVDKAEPLSIRRLKLAAKAMPVLFGGDVQLWERWVSEMETIPGALFVLSDHLPVRGKLWESMSYVAK
jgi:hypothetical protein